MYVADTLRRSAPYSRVLDSQGLIAELRRLRDEGVTKNADLARLLNLPTPRIAEIFDGTRRVTIDEMKVLVEHFHLEAQAVPPSAEMLEPILDALLPLAPPGRMTDRSRRALAEALSYGLGLLDSPSAKQATADAVQVAARAAVARFREKVLAS